MFENKSVGSKRAWRGEGVYMTELLHTPLTDWHIENGAKMAEFAGYSMPISYPTGALKEIYAVRNAAGLFDISHMRPIFVEGPLARNFLNFIDTRDLSQMKVGDARYGIVCLESGEPIDDIIVYLLSGTEESERFLVIANASNGTRVYEHLRSVKRKYGIANEQVFLTDGLGKYGFISLQGPNAEEILKNAVSDISLIPKKYYSCANVRLFDEPVLLSKTGYTGEAGFEILCPKFAAYYHWLKLLDVGEPLGLIPAGLAARDTLRLEAGMPLFGHEMDKRHDPVSAGLEKFVDFDKFGYFLGKTALKKVRDGRSGKPSEYFHSFIMEKGRVPRHGDNVYWEYADPPIGKLTSAGFSPTLGKNIAMGYIYRKFSSGSEVFIDIGGKLYPATVTKLPFYKRVKK